MNPYTKPIEPYCCPQCVDTRGMIVIRDSKGNTHSEQCPCEALKRWRFEKRMMQAKIPREFIGKVLEDFVCQNQSQLYAAGIAKKLMEGYPLENSEKGIVFDGSCGTGKSMLAAVILHNLILKGAAGRFLKTGTLLSQLKDSYNDDSEDRERILLEDAATAEVLVLDELGQDKPTAWVQDKLDWLIDQRYEQQRLTIITTNYEFRAGKYMTYLAEDRKMPSDYKPVLGDRIGERAFSRLCSMCVRVNVYADDYRQTDGLAEL